MKATYDNSSWHSEKSDISISLSKGRVTPLSVVGDEIAQAELNKLKARRREELSKCDEAWSKLNRTRKYKLLEKRIFEILDMNKTNSKAADAQLGRWFSCLKFKTKKRLNQYAHVCKYLQVNDDIIEKHCTVTDFLDSREVEEGEEIEVKWNGSQPVGSRQVKHWKWCLMTVRGQDKQTRLGYVNVELRGEVVGVPIKTVRRPSYLDRTNLFGFAKELLDVCSKKLYPDYFATMENTYNKEKEPKYDQFQGEYRKNEANGKWEYRSDKFPVLSPSALGFLGKSAPEEHILALRAMS